MQDHREPANIKVGSLDERAAAFEVSLGTLTGAGVRFVARSRIDAYLRTLRDQATTPNPDAGLRGAAAIQLLNAIGELDELGFAAAQLSELVAIDEAWRGKFSHAFTGAVRSFAQHDPARDAQFELLAAANCRAAGGRPRHEEPDILVDVGIKTLAIAAKRIRSIKRLEEHVRKARSQILGTAHGGLIALDLTRAFRLDSTVFLATSLEQLNAIRNSVFSRVERVGGDVQRWILASPGGEQVKVVATYCRWMAVDRTTQSTAITRQWIAGPIPAFSYTARPLKRFVMRLMGSTSSSNRG